MRARAFFWVCVLWLAACAAQQRPLQLVSGAGPIYPATAKANRIEGQVVVGYDVDVDGVVQGAHVVSADPPGVFDAAALQAVSSWRFSPRVVDGVAVASRGLTSTVRFKLSDGDDPYRDL